MKQLYIIENKLSTIGAFMDLSKAFDTIDHNILFKKNLNGMEYVGRPWIGSKVTSVT